MKNSCAVKALGNIVGSKKERGWRKGKDSPRRAAGEAGGS